jgi:hypothetical protein
MYTLLVSCWLNAPVMLVLRCACFGFAVFHLIVSFVWIYLDFWGFCPVKLLDYSLISFQNNNTRNLYFRCSFEFWLWCLLKKTLNFRFFWHLSMLSLSTLSWLTNCPRALFCSGWLRLDALGSNFSWYLVVAMGLIVMIYSRTTRPWTIHPQR